MKLGGWARLGILASVGWIVACVINTGPKVLLEPLSYIGAHVQVFASGFSQLPDGNADYDTARAFSAETHLTNVEKGYSNRFVKANSVRDIEHIRQQIQREQSILRGVNEKRAHESLALLVLPIAAGWIAGWLLLVPGRRVGTALVRWVLDGFRSN